MPRKARELSSLELRRLEAPGRHAVGGVAGLLLYVQPNGTRSWILRVVVGGQRRDMGLGGFPDVTLEEARSKARVQRALVDQGKDPIAQRLQQRAELRAAHGRTLTFDQ